MSENALTRTDTAAPALGRIVTLLALAVGVVILVWPGKTAMVVTVAPSRP